MSHALSRLRELFGDPLFIRTAEAMRPTTRALELAAPIAGVLADIRQKVLADRAFAPERAEITFRVGASDHIELAILPAVLAALQSSAPQARVAVTSVDRDRLATLLESGAIDVAIGYFPDPSGALSTEVLFHEDLVCLYDAKACGVSGPLTLESYLDLPHIVMSLRGELSGVVDRHIDRTDHRRFVLMATPHFLAIPFLLHGFRAAAAVPRRLAENCRDVTGLTVCPLPVPLVGFDVSMQWHARTETDPAHIWFRDLIRAAGRAEPPSPRPKKKR